MPSQSNPAVQNTSEIGSIDRLPGYEELERDMPGIDSTVIERLKIHFFKISETFLSYRKSGTKSNH